MSANFSIGVLTQRQPDLQKQQLLDALQQQQQQLITAADAFYAQEQRSEASYLGLCDSIVTTVNQILSSNVDESLFVRNIKKSLQQLRDDALQVKHAATGQVADDHVAVAPLTDDQQYVYVSLFQSNGDTLSQWAVQLKSLHRYLIGRAVYAQVEHVEKMIRAKMTRSSEAYVIVKINKSGVRNDPYLATQHDRNGSVLLSLVEGSIKNENIVAFVHQGQRYRFLDGRLFLQ